VIVWPRLAGTEWDVASLPPPSPREAAVAAEKAAALKPLKVAALKAAALRAAMGMRRQQGRWRHREGVEALKAAAKCEAAAARGGSA
jgi:hypothetical protein